MATTTPTTAKKKKKPSSVRHTRAIQRDRSKRPAVAPSAPAVEARLSELVQPATYAQVAAYQAQGLRARVLTLPVMVAFVLSLIWRQLGSVREAVRVLQTEGHLWAGPLAVSPQAVGQRLRAIPAGLFRQVLEDLLPRLHERHVQRERPVPPAVRWARQHFTAVLALDGSTLDALLRKVGLLQEAAGSVLAGRMAALLDVVSRLPRQVWYEEDSAAHDQRFWARLLPALSPGLLLLFDLGFFNYPHFDDLTDRHLSFTTRATKNMACTVERVLQTSSVLRDRVVRVGSSADSRCHHPLRLVEVRHQGKWYRYLTNVLDPAVLPAEYVVALYWQRWRIEDAFAVVKRVLGLAYFWAGSQNGVQVQVWATWLLYAVLVDLTDELAERLRQPYAALSLEMVYRGLYHFTQAFHREEADDPITYLATHAKRLGILKQRRPHRPSPTALLHLTLAQKA